MARPKKTAYTTAADKSNGNSDTWVGFSYYCMGLKQMADGDNKGAIASFQQMLAAKSHFINTQLEARSWIKLAGGTVPAAKSGTAKPAPAKKK